MKTFASVERHLVSSSKYFLL